jgi:hypothetical protein
MRADADNGMTFTTQTGQIGVYATTNSALLASGHSKNRNIEF